MKHIPMVKPPFNYFNPGVSIFIFSHCCICEIYWSDLFLQENIYWQLLFQLNPRQDNKEKCTFDELTWSSIFMICNLTYFAFSIIILKSFFITGKCVFFNSLYTYSVPQGSQWPCAFIYHLFPFISLLDFFYFLIIKNPYVLTILCFDVLITFSFFSFIAFQSICFKRSFFLLIFSASPISEPFI